MILCAYCEQLPAAHRDHVIPRSRGGDDAEGNILPACAGCNLSKSDRTPSEWRPEGLPARIYALEGDLRDRYRLTARTRRGPQERKASPDNPFELALQNEFTTLDDGARRTIIRVHDDLYVARTIAQSIYGDDWAQHCAEVYRLLREREREDGR